MKRGLKNDVRKFLSFALGIVEELQLENFHNNIRKNSCDTSILSYTCRGRKYIHLNMSRVQIKENWQTIPQLIEPVHALNTKLELTGKELKADL